MTFYPSQLQSLVNVRANNVPFIGTYSQNDT